MKWKQFKAICSCSLALIVLVLGASLPFSGTASAKENKQVFIIDFALDPFLISEVNVVVQTKWLKSPGKAHMMALDMTITGLNGGFAEHGSQLVRLEEATFVFGDSEFSEISVEWTQDNTSTVAGEVYTVCATVVSLDKDDLIKKTLGSETCRDFGPF